MKCARTFLSNGENRLKKKFPSVSEIQGDAGFAATRCLSFKNRATVSELTDYNRHRQYIVHYNVIVCSCVNCAIKNVPHWRTKSHKVAVRLM